MTVSIEQGNGTENERTQPGTESELSDSSHSETGHRSADSDRRYECLDCGAVQRDFLIECPDCGGSAFETGKASSQTSQSLRAAVVAFTAQINPYVPR